MSKLILITGGARSGKSTFAEEKAKEWGRKVLYVATSKPIDEEMKQRIAKHKARRPSEWDTLEEYKNLDTAILNVLQDKDTVLLDCITIMITNLMLEEACDWDSLTRDKVEEIEDLIQHQIERIISLSKMTEALFILVTNETGLGVVPAAVMGRDFRDISGRVNQMLARAADEVYFCVSGIPMKIK
ncbi:adenosylcobinamide kinase /adenosylcobinamide-phosphate guanylyltransferase [Ruminiclostridium sufflavum DSM 19573]|uniref:Adenosylcobinamide kinase n=1 Tax=Ruminiclostridium sufflavum DSM 19573 TaxID=1121337 RepID=A0A318Y2V2_9FIRM|nr:bifunctional adenosylcobinamide kinase/adenosylcobinamide-phosphate guanylyltransferase [Ruminiclostridium sufflavum]PYG85806.1 adenosylcobinamide kinase /adenosylcobinamide-phosphate guanylyltransferase [Ruminiclostridium sufflavum DSM 19573]